MKIILHKKIHLMSLKYKLQYKRNQETLQEDLLLFLTFCIEIFIYNSIQFCMIMHTYFIYLHNRNS